MNIEEIISRDDGFEHWTEFEDQNKDLALSNLEPFNKIEDRLEQLEACEDQQKTVNDQAHEDKVRNKKLFRF